MFLAHDKVVTLMPISLAQGKYGESRVRLMKVSRRQDRHDVKQITAAIRFEGDFESSFTSGDNANVLPADTMKNTVYALAKLYPIEQVEEFGRQVADHFLTDRASISRLSVDLVEELWAHVPYGGKPHGNSFTPGARERRTALVRASREETSIEGGITGLQLLKTAGAEFRHYIRDPFTTLPESADRVLAVSVNARWTYTELDIPFGPYWHGAREALVESFIEHESKSLQHTLYAMGEAVLERYQDIAEISLSIASSDHMPVDLQPFGLQNENEVFEPAAEPFGVVEARIVRAGRS